MPFSVKTESSISRARVGELLTNHGAVETPVFMPIATVGAVKFADRDDLERLGAQIILGNTYHLMLRPGEEVIRAAGGLHGFMNWQKPILTDSGGYQVYSLARLLKISDQGALFRSHLDGSEHMLSPERSMEVQEALGSDVVMALDECPDYPASREAAEQSLKRTAAWAIRSKEHYKKINGSGMVFGIQQGSTYSDLRKRAARELSEIGFDGYAVGGLSFEEPREETYGIVSDFDSIIPRSAPRYFMGGGEPHEIIEYVKRGIDMFDCVLPTRNARHGSLYVWEARSDWTYAVVHITNESFKRDFEPLARNCPCLACKNHTKAYLRHLFCIGDPLGPRLGTIHNLQFYMELMSSLRERIENSSI